MNWRDLLEDVKTLAVQTGRFLVSERNLFDKNRVEMKGAHDYVSYVDKESEHRIVARLHELLPEAGFIAEEGSGELGEGTYFWVVDPLDGTTNYIHGHAPYCVSIALRNKDELLMGVVYECCYDELFWACKDTPAYLNGQEIHVSDVAEMKKAFVELGFPYRSDVYSPFASSLVTELYGKVGGLRLIGAAAAELCYVAVGRFDIRIEGFLGPWDIAAGGLILRQAGGMMTDFSGNEDCLDAREVLASNGYLHESILKVVSKRKKLLKS